MKNLNILVILLTAFFLSACSSSRDISYKLDEINIIPRSGWNADEPKIYETQVPVRITIHHEGTIFTEDKDAAKHIKNVQKWGMGPDRNWTDIPYHFLIDPKGNIYEGRNVFTAGETNTEYDPNGHLLITCLGNFEEQEISDAQLKALIEMTAFAAKKYNIDPETIASHRDHSKITSCPGKNLYEFIENGFIKQEVKKLLN